MDDFLRSAYPLVMAPTETVLNPPEKDGIRYIVASDGLWQDIQSNWLYVLRRIAGAAKQTTPFGTLETQLVFKCSSPPVKLWRAFIAEAQKALPNECAGLIVWNCVTNTWRLTMREAANSSASHIEYVNPELHENEVGVIDVHSHGKLNAFFSTTDNLDDAHSIKISAVFGNIHSTPTILLRLCVLGKFYKLSLDEQGNCKFQI